MVQTVGLISIHAPREGGDVVTPAALYLLLIFQSTPPARGATLLRYVTAHLAV